MKSVDATSWFLLVNIPTKGLSKVKYYDASGWGRGSV